MHSRMFFPTERAMGFYHEDGLVPSFKRAAQFAGPGGRVATLPDIAFARLHSKPGDYPWETYFTTSSAEYIGRGRNGRWIAIVAHGVGPMSTLDGILAAYSYEYKDKKERRRRGGRISREEFLKLERGDYGPVGIVDIESYLFRFEYPFLEYQHESDAIEDPLLRARLGRYATPFIRRLGEFAREWHRERDELWVKDPVIIGVHGANNCPYQYTLIEEDMALAHLLSTGGLYSMSSGEHGKFLGLDISCHEWFNGVRFAGVRQKIRGETQGFTISDGPDVERLMWKFWQELLEPVDSVPSQSLYPLMEFAGGIWTQRPKKGWSLDTHIPEYRCVITRKMGEPVTLRTKQSSYPGFFRHDTQEVRALMPKGANGYALVGEGWLEGSEHACWNVQFYHVELDVSHRLMRPEQLKRDFGLQMRLLELERCEKAAA